MELEFQNVTKRFGSQVAVDGVSFRMKGGDFVGLIGPNGAGKTTALRMAVGHLEPTDGRVVLDGAGVMERPLEARKRIGYVPEFIALYDYLTGAEYLEFVGELKGLSTRDREAGVEELYEVLQLGEERHRLIRTYSQGMRRKVAIAAALLGHPPFLVLDEALNGLDPTTLHGLKAYLTACSRRGMGILISSHVLEVLERLCNRIAMLYGGKLVAVLDAEELERVRGQDGGLEQHFMLLVEGVQAGLGRGTGVSEQTGGTGR